VIATHLSIAAAVSMKGVNVIEEKPMMRLVMNLLRGNHDATLAITRWTITPALVDLFDDDDLCIELDETDVLLAAAAA
jgi:hypothetical protein